MSNEGMTASRPTRNHHAREMMAHGSCSTLGRPVISLRCTSKMPPRASSNQLLHVTPNRTVRISQSCRCVPCKPPPAAVPIGVSERPTAKPRADSGPPGAGPVDDREVAAVEAIARQYKIRQSLSSLTRIPVGSEDAPFVLGMASCMPDFIAGAVGMMHQRRATEPDVKARYAKIEKELFKGAYAGHARLRSAVMKLYGMMLRAATTG